MKVLLKNINDIDPFIRDNYSFYFKEFGCYYDGKHVVDLDDSEGSYEGGTPDLGRIYKVIGEGIFESTAEKFFIEQYFVKFDFSDIEKEFEI